MTITAAVVRRDNSTQLFERAAGVWRTSGNSRAGLWPAPRPLSSTWTVSEIAEAARLVSFGDGSESEVGGSRSEPPLLMGPRLGHYAFWSPGGEALCYVVPDGRSLTLNVWSAVSGSLKSFASGSPMFPAWLGTSGWLLVHHGATLSAFHVHTGEQRVISTSAAGFRAPAVTDEGTFGWAEVRDGAVHVMTSSLDGEPARAARFEGGTALSFRPGSTDLFAAVASNPESGVFAGLYAVDGPQPRRIVAGPLVAYWWSPDGSKVMTLHPSYSGDGRFQPRLHDASGRFLGAVDAFIPSGDTGTIVGFFDQYASSHPSWSADSRWFGLCGRFMDEGPHSSWGAVAGDVAWAWDTEKRGPVEQLTHGTMLSFSRAQVNDG